MTRNSVTALLNEWPDRQAVHLDAKGTDQDLEIVAVHRWFQRGAVPVKYWRALIDGGRRRGILVDAERFLTAHAGLVEPDAGVSAPADPEHERGTA